MDSTQASSPFKTFKSKKKLQIGSDPDVSGSQDPWSSKTPEKPIIPPRRTRNRSAALSLKEVRQAAQKLHKPDPTRTESSLLKSPAAKPKKPAADPIKLPEKYELLDKFFSSMDSSIRLLKLKGSSATFTNISTKVECLTDRRFCYTHLAQLKFLLPEAIEIKKILVLDERTNCMKPDLHITLNANGVDEKLKSSSDTVQLRKIFRNRLLEFFKSHPEGDDIPKEALPGALDESKQETLTNSSGTVSSQLVDETQIGSVQKQPAAASHLSQSFRRSFSHQVSAGDAKNAKQHPTVPHTSVCPVPVHQIVKCSSNKNTSTAANKTPSKLLSSKTSTSTARFSSRGAHSATLPSSPLPATPLKDSYSSFTAEGTPAKHESTPAKHKSTPAKLMTSTPVLLTPKRCYMSPDGESTESPRKLIRRPPRSRSLTFDTPVKSSEEVSNRGGSSTDDEILDILPENLLQSIREKERKALEEQDPAISQAKWRKQMISSLPKFFDMIYFLFQSMKRSVITKEELMHKVISSHLETADKREVEEQLSLLQEIAPEWIYEKVASTGDVLFCVSKISNPESIRTRIAEVK